ncbi:MAG: ATP-binding protein [Desulfovibrio sp.]|jgi:hypothetical protein|nr:ATP-binding protein [Desulfovibrio sp.]
MEFQLINGTYDFKEIREKNCIYVDKTQFIANMLSNYQRVFIARPRRFGKSLMVSTLESLFNAECRSLFHGLQIENRLDEPIFSPRPVLSIDMSKTVPIDIKAFEETLHFGLLDIAHIFNIALDGKIPALNLAQIIQDISEAHGKKIVLLIDEYDTPLLDTFDNKPLHDEIHRQLQFFYRQIKACEKFIDFVYVTGISMLSNAGGFLGLNNLTDLTMENNFAEMFGYTEKEIEIFFAPYIETVSKKVGMKREDFFARIRKYYNGYSFDGTAQVCNPVSIGRLFKLEDFDEYWIETGSQESVAKFVAQSNVDFDELDGYIISESEARNPGEITTDLGAALYLCQSGYLTLRKTNDHQEFLLVYPNDEVRAAMAELIVSSYFHNDMTVSELRGAIVSAVENSDYKSLLNICNRMFSKFLHQNQKFPKDATGDYKEGVYRSHLATFFYGTDFTVRSEESSNIGDSGVVFEYNDKTVVFELKYYEEGKYKNDADGRLEEATTQIVNRNYAGSYEEPLSIGAAVDGACRSITRAAFNGVACRIDGCEFVAFGTVDKKGRIVKSC